MIILSNLGEGDGMGLTPSPNEDVQIHPGFSGRVFCGRS